MSNEWDRYAAGETYQDVEKMVRQFAGQTARMYNLDFEAAVSAANVGFMQAFKTFIPELGYEFTTWCGEKVKRRLQDFVKEEFSRLGEPLVRVDTQPFKYNAPFNERVGLKNDFTKECQYTDEAFVDKTIPPFDLDGFVGELSADAAMVTRLVFETPPDIKVSVAQIGVDSPEAFRNAVREFLLDQGWSKRRIQRTFLEIREHL